MHFGFNHPRNHGKRLLTFIPSRAQPLLPMTHPQLIAKQRRPIDNGLYLALLHVPREVHLRAPYLWVDPTGRRA